MNSERGISLDGRYMPYTITAFVAPGINYKKMYCPWHKDGQYFHRVGLITWACAHTDHTSFDETHDFPKITTS